MFSNYILILGLSGIYANGCHDGAKKDICGANGPYIPHLLTRGPDIDVTVELFKTEYCDVYAIDLGQWYHSNIPMTNTCPDAYMCGTKFPIWLQGENPIENEGVVNLTACLRDFDECCLRTYRISAVSCGVTMAYCFHELPSGCHQRYCFGIKDSFTNHDQKLASSKTPMKTSEHKQTSTALRSTGTSDIVQLLHSPSNEESNQQTTDVPLTSSVAQSERSTNPMYILTKSTPRGNDVEGSSINPEQTLPSRKTPMETSKDKQTSTALRSSGSDFKTTHITPLIHSPSNSNEEPDQQTTNEPLKSTIAQKSMNLMYRLTNTTPRGNDVEDSSANFDQILPSSKTSMETSEAKQTSTALRSAGSYFRTSHIVPFIHSPSNEEPNQQTTNLPFKSSTIEQSEQSTNPMYTLINTRPRGNDVEDSSTNTGQKLPSSNTSMVTTDVTDSSTNPDQTLPSSEKPMETSEDKQTSTALRSTGSDFRTSLIVPLIQSPSNLGPNQQTTDEPLTSSVAESKRSTYLMHILTNSTLRGNDVEDSSTNFNQTLASSKPSMETSDVKDSSTNPDETTTSSTTPMETSENKQTSTASRSRESDFRTTHIIPLLNSLSNEESNQQTPEEPLNSSIAQSEQLTNPILMNTKPRGNDANVSSTNPDQTSASSKTPMKTSKSKDYFTIPDQTLASIKTQMVTLEVKYSSTSPDKTLASSKTPMKTSDVNDSSTNPDQTLASNKTPMKTSYVKVSSTNPDQTLASSKTPMRTYSFTNPDQTLPTSKTPIKTSDVKDSSTQSEKILASSNTPIRTSDVKDSSTDLDQTLASSKTPIRTSDVKDPSTNPDQTLTSSKTPTKTSDVKDSSTNPDQTLASSKTPMKTSDVKDSSTNPDQSLASSKTPMETSDVKDSSTNPDHTLASSKTPMETSDVKDTSTNPDHTLASSKTSMETSDVKDSSTDPDHTLASNETPMETSDVKDSSTNPDHTLASSKTSMETSDVKDSSTNPDHTLASSKTSMKSSDIKDSSTNPPPPPNISIK